MTEMQRAYAVAGAAVRQRLLEQDPRRFEALASLGKNDVAVFQGTYDEAQRVLGVLDVPYRMNPRSLRGGLRRKRFKIAFVNCASSATDARVAAVRRFVEDGGWLVSSDWALGHVVAKAFPQTIGWDRQRSTRDEVVSVEPARDSLWREIVVPGVLPQWWLEGGSHAIAVHDARVRIEAASHDMLARYDAPVVAASFLWGEGRVFHAISHFWLKRTRNQHERHGEPGERFLHEALGLSPDGVAKALGCAGGEVSYGALQSAVTASELVAQLCIAAVC
ncbi:MAG: hypothetical protein KC503_32050 [Myxococcales bacterium]|nr:hypothetical protein [Myxococcales bacterium]